MNRIQQPCIIGFRMVCDKWLELVKMVCDYFKLLNETFCVVFFEAIQWNIGTERYVMD